MVRMSSSLVAWSLLLWALPACTSMDGRVRRASEFPSLRQGGLRVAALPFAVSAAEDDAVSGSLAPLAGLLALEGLGADAPQAMAAGGVMQRALLALLAGSPLNMEEQWVTRTELAHAGFSMSALQDRQRAREFAELLHVDALLYGEVYEWDRSYYGLQSTQSVGLRVWLIDGATGEELAFAERWRREGAGLSGGPTGYFSVATAPIQGLASSTLSFLAIQVAYDIAEDLLGGAPPQSFDFANARGTSPRLSVVAADPLGDPGLAAGERLQVVAVGTAGSRVSFDLGGYRTRVPMLEVDSAADPRGGRSTYVGHYVVQAGEELAASPIRVHIERTNADGSVMRGETKIVNAGRVVIAAR